MSYLDPATRAGLTAQLLVKTAQRDAANATLLAAAGNAEVESYSFDSGEGKQTTKRRKPEDIHRLVRELDSEILRIQNRLGGQGVVNMNLRRRRWGL